MRRLIVTADDFGLSESVNEAVERAHTDGILAAASLMVGGPAAADAVRRAKAMPSLRVGLHLVVIEGPAILPPRAIPDLVDASGQFPSGQLGLGMRYFLRPAVRRQLAAEIDAQFAAFAATGLALDHANAHKHMHLHPVVGRLMIAAGRAYGLRAIRLPAEPGLPETRTTAAGRALLAWTRILRRQARDAGLATNEFCFGIGWTGQMTSERLIALAPALPEGVSEVYLHPATRRDEVLSALMPEYRHEQELAALLDTDVRAALEANGIARIAGFEAI